MTIVKASKLGSLLSPIASNDAMYVRAILR